MLFCGYICNKRFEKCERQVAQLSQNLKSCKAATAVSDIKKLLIRALTKSPGVSTSGLSFFCISELFCGGKLPAAGAEFHGMIREPHSIIEESHSLIGDSHALFGAPAFPITRTPGSPASTDCSSYTLH